MAKRQDSKLVVAEIHIANVLGIRKKEIVPGQITEFRGKNGSGKTSPLEAIKAALGGGNLAKLRNIHAPEGEDAEVVLVLDGPGSESYRVTKKGEKTARVQARVGDTQAFEDVPRPAAWLHSLFDREGANPLTYLEAKDEERAKLLLEALPLEMDRAELEHILGLDAKHVPMLPTGLHPLKELELIVEAIKRACTGVNVNARGKADAAEQTRRKLPAQIPADPVFEISKLDVETQALAREVGKVETQADADEAAAIKAASAAYALEEQRLKGEFQLEAKKLRDAHAAKAAELRAEVERQIAALKGKTDEAIDDLNTAAIGNIDAAEETKDAAIGAARSARETARFAIEAQKRDLAAKREELAALRMVAQEGAAARALQQQAKQFEEEADELKAELKRMRATVDALEAFGRRLSDHLPIPGLRIEGDRILVDGVVFEQLNLGQRVEIACRVACLRAREQRLPLLFVDRAESLDDEHLAALKDFLLREGVQAWISRVTNDDFEVETIGEAVTA